MPRDITIYLSLTMLMLLVGFAAAGDEEPEPKSEAAIKAKTEFLTKVNELDEEYKAKIKKLREKYHKDLDGARKAELEKSDLNEAQRILTAKVLDQDNAIDTPGVAILFTAYGSGNKDGWVNVTELVRKKVKKNRVRFLVDQAGFGDPKFGVKKSAVVVYAVSGKVYVVIRGQDEWVDFAPGKP
jgi:hypothetical protein